MSTGKQAALVLQAVESPEAAIVEQHEALGHLRRMNDDMISANETIIQLRSELAQARNRIEFLTMERERDKSDMLTYRDLVIRMSAQLANIGDMTKDAQHIYKQVQDLKGDRSEQEQKSE